MNSMERYGMDEVLEAMPISVSSFIRETAAHGSPAQVATTIVDLAPFFRFVLARNLTEAPIPRLITAAELCRVSPADIAEYPRFLMGLDASFASRDAIVRNMKAVQALLRHLVTQAQAPRPPAMPRRPMRLGVSYIVFDGVELLESSIDQIRSKVDFLQVIYQEVSWFGHAAKPEDLETMHRLRATGKIDELTLFKGFEPIHDRSPRSIQRAKTYERLKRQLGLLTCLARGCTHYLSMDVDEFYVTEEFGRARAEVERHDHALTAVRYMTYVRTPRLCRGLSEKWFVPFICRINEQSWMGAQYFVLVDPTRGVHNGSRSEVVLPPEMIRMHHMESVRKDLYLKYDATTRANLDRGRLDDLVRLISEAGDRGQTFGFDGIIPGAASFELTACENIFNIPYEFWV
jgi:hypothetical protein